MIEVGGIFMTDFEWAPHLAKNLVLSESPKIHGSKDIQSAVCNFPFSAGVMKDSKWFFLIFRTLCMNYAAIISICCIKYCV